MISLSLHDGALVLKTKEKSLEAFPKGKPSADITLLANPVEEPKGNQISWPGEYDMGGVSIRGIAHEEGKRVSFAAETEGVRFAFLASPLHDWSDGEIEQLGNIDVLAIAADDAKIAQKLIEEIDPRIVVPLPGNGNFQEVLKACGAENAERMDEYKIKGSLPAEGREVVVLSE